VGHREYLERPLADLIGKLRRGGSFIDVKSRFDRHTLEQAGAKVWRL